MSPFLVVIILFIIGYKFYEFITCVPPNSPPCIPRLPIVGSYWYLLWGNYEYPFKTIRYYVNKLKSNILTCYFGGVMTIIVNDYDSVKEVLTREEFAGRATNVDLITSRTYGRNRGIFFTEGSFWQEQRRFTLKHMRDFGFGKRDTKYEANVVEEAALLVKMLREGPNNDEEKTFLKNGSALFPDILYPYFANNIWDIMFGERFDRSQHRKGRYLCESAMMLQRASDTTGGAIFQFWFLKYLGNMFGFKNFIKGNFRLKNFFREQLEHQKYSDNDYDRGLVDKYIKKLNENENTKSTFSEEQFIMTLVDFMFPALSASPSATVHALKAVMHHPEVMRKIQEEIDKVVGTGRLVTWEDRKSLPYTEAAIRESLRIETLTPLSVFHKAIRETTLCGYNVPKDTLIVINLSGLHSDPNLWKDPENFRPERFLNENGELGKDLSFPFGLGRRVCAGETYARYTLFEAFAALMQNFNFSFVEGEPTSLEDKMPGLIVTPKETWIRVEPRYT